MPATFPCILYDSATIEFFSTTHLLRTNDPPSEAEQKMLRGMMTSAERDVTDCDDTIAYCTEIVVPSFLRHRRDGAFLIYQDCKTILSPVRRIPREVIAEILLHALQSVVPDHDWAFSVTVDTRDGPWKYGQVCSIWRELVLSLPHLWTHFVFDLDSVLEIMDRETHRENLSIILHRSKNLPLSFVFEESTPEFSHPGIFTQLLSMSDRWKDVELTINHTTPFLRLNAFRGKFPVLEQLSLHLPFTTTDPLFANSTREEITASLAMNGFAEAPRLSAVKYDLPYDHETPHDLIDISFPLGQLKYYEEVDAPLPNFPQYIAEGVNLVECVIGRQDNWFWMMDWPVDPGLAYPVAYHLPLLHLRKLTSTSSELQYMVVPHLENLRLDIRETFRLHGLLSFLSRNHCALQTFTLTGWVKHTDQLIEALRLMPSLTSLRLKETGYEAYSAILPLLIISNSTISGSNTDYFLPRLESFTVVLEVDLTESELDEVLSDDMDMLEAMIQSRRTVDTPEVHAVARLRKLYCSFGPGVCKRKAYKARKVAARFKKWREDGLCIRVEFRKKYAFMHPDILEEIMLPY